MEPGRGKVHFDDPIQVHTDYATFNRKYEEYNLKEHDLDKYEDRKLETALSHQTRKEIISGKMTTVWRGVHCMKDPFTLVVLQHLLYDIKPQTIIEFGSCSGGSALYVADMMKVYGFKTHVYSIDIDLELLNPLAREKREDITFLQGDSKKVEEVFPSDFLKTLPHPWFVIEDAHVNVFGILDYFDQFLIAGDYILVEDIDPIVGSETHGETREWDGDKKDAQLAAFIKKYPDKYRVDKRYTDFYGYNGSCNWNGYIKHI